MLQSILGRCLSLLLIAAMLGGCSFATRFAYNHLDWLASRELAKYVDLSRAQKADVETRFERLWAWHRQQELPLYAEDLNRLAQQARAGFTDQDLRDFLDTGERWGQRLIAQALPDVATVMAGFSDEQIADILAQVDEENAEYREEYVDLPEDERRAGSAKRMRKSLDKRLGSLSTAQKQRIEQWANSRQLNAEGWAGVQARWRDDFEAVLATRGNPGFAERLGPLLVPDDSDWPPELVSSNAYNTALWVDMILDIDASMTPGQRAHLVDHIEDFARDFKVLSEQAP